MTKKMEVIFQHCLVTCEGEPDEPRTTVHAINKGLQG